MTVPPSYSNAITASASTFIVAADEIQSLLYWMAAATSPGGFNALPALLPFMQQLLLQVWGKCPNLGLIKKEDQSRAC